MISASDVEKRTVSGRVHDSAGTGLTNVRVGLGRASLRFLSSRKSYFQLLPSCFQDVRRSFDWAGPDRLIQLWCGSPGEHVGLAYVCFAETQVL